MKRLKRSAALLLTLCLLTSCFLTAPAGAADTTEAVTAFSDVTDPNTAAAIESLRLLGVLDGYADGTFRPEESLTRAQFCKMAVYALNAGSQEAQYKNYTIFPDVRPSYWAAGYINLAAKGKKIISGFADGSFGPDRTVTCGQAVTILMRLLGYADTDVGPVWPDGYLTAAASIGLADGLNGAAALTRGQAATLFAALLASDKKDGTSYASSIASTTQPNAVLLSCSATAEDGTSGAMQVASSGTVTVYRMANRSGSGSLDGRKGTLLLNGAGRVLTFVPTTEGYFRTITVSAAQSGSLTDTSGGKYTVKDTATAYYNGETTTYSALASWLTGGISATLYFGSSGTVEYVYFGGEAATGAVIVSANGSTAGFDSLTGGNTGYTIYKDGEPATAADLRKYDVATYNSATNTIRVCDSRITGYYENCSPTASAPTKVTVVGHEFSVLSTASSSLSGFKLGNQVTLLLTEDNQVAGAVEASGTTAGGNAVGLATALTSTSATVRLLSGLTVSGKVSLTDLQVSQMTGQLVQVSSVRSGSLSLSALSGTVASSLDVAGRKLGNASLSNNAVLYEKVGSSALTQITLDRLTTSSVPYSQIAYASYDWAGRVKILVLNDVTGGCYTYGVANYTPAQGSSDLDNWSYESAKVYVTYGNGKATSPVSTSYACSNGDYIGLALSADGTKAAGLQILSKLASVPNSAWSGQTLVTVSGKSYSVASNVVCYNKTAGSFLTLSAARAYSSTANLYVDSHNVVRVVEVS